MHTLKLKTELIKRTKKDRLYQLDIPIIGLTGGIACGKTTVSNMFKQLGVPVIDADSLIHSIYASSKTVDFIKKIKADIIVKGSIDFTKLRKLFFTDENVKNKIQNYLYAKLPEYFLLEAAKYQDAEFLIYDVPLLFENNLQSYIDFTITVYAPRNIQIERVSTRDGTDKELIQKILDQQMDIESKKDLADFVLNNANELPQLESNFQVLTGHLFQ